MLTSGRINTWNKHFLNPLDGKQEVYANLLGNELEHGQELGLSSSAMLGSSAIEAVGAEVMSVSGAASAPLVSTKIVVTASGTSAGGVFPHFRVLVDGVKVGEATTGSTAKTYAVDAKVA